MNYSIFIHLGLIISSLSPAIIADLYILDIRNYNWVTTATINKLGPTSASTPIPTKTEIPSSPASALIIGIATSVAGIILIGSVIAGIFIHKRRQERRYSIATPGSINLDI
ncbi:6297_t:CDS:1 [Dentiscutata heterogama]|uniref:6297_t:CDS:1 n=1 Tax=Dentiscutata heterogama TaxID=1316150 RepID=A0ACA9N6U4_9GLOM|nr:6297_t:CDS:1 [Dentiscutata heterogama]